MMPPWLPPPLAVLCPTDSWALVQSSVAAPLEAAAGAGDGVLLEVCVVAAGVGRELADGGVLTGECASVEDREGWRLGDSAVELDCTVAATEDGAEFEEAASVRFDEPEHPVRPTIRTARAATPAVPKGVLTERSTRRLPLVGFYLGQKDLPHLTYRNADFHPTLTPPNSDPAERAIEPGRGGGGL